MDILESEATNLQGEVVTLREKVQQQVEGLQYRATCCVTDKRSQYQKQFAANIGQIHDCL